MPRPRDTTLGISLMAALALVAFLFTGTYHPAEGRAYAAFREQVVEYLDAETLQRLAKADYVVPVRQLDERTAPNKTPTRFIAEKENPFSGKTTADKRTALTKADVKSAADRKPAGDEGAQKNDQGSDVRDKEKSVFMPERGKLNLFTGDRIPGLDGNRSPFQELPDLSLSPDLLLNFDMNGQVSLGTTAYRFAEYFFRMVRKVGENWGLTIPMAHYYGLMKSAEILVVFELDADGKVRWARVSKGNDQPSLEESCRRAVLMAGDFGPVPADLVKDGKLTIPFLFVYRKPSEPYRMFH